MHQIVEKIIDACTNQEFKQPWPLVNTGNIVELVVLECVQYLNDEIDRLVKYQNSLPDDEQDKKHDVDLVIEKCYDNIEGIKDHFGLKQLGDQ